MYFTIWTNVAAALVFGAFVLLFGSTLGQNPTGATQHRYTILTRIAMYLTTSLVLVTVAYWILLAPIATGSLLTFSNLTTHLVTPVLLLLFTIFFLRSGLLRRRDIYLTAIIPLVYVVAVYVAYALGYRYTFSGGGSHAFPYFFLDYHQLGWSMVITYIIGIAIVVIAAGCGLYAIDRRKSARSIR